MKKCAFYRNIRRYLTVYFLFAVLHVPVAAGEPLLQRKMPPTFTSLPLLIRTFTQKGTQSQRALIAFENRSIVLMYYFQKEYVIREFHLDSEIFDAIEVYRDDTNLESNFFLVSTGNGICLYSLGKEPWKRIDIFSDATVARFCPVNDNKQIIGYDNERVSIIRLSDQGTEIARIDELYHTPDKDIVAVAAVPAADRFLVVRGRTCISYRTDGTLEWTHELPEPVIEHAEWEVSDRVSSISRESMGALEIWNSYERPVRVLRNSNSCFLVYPASGALIFCEIDSRSIVHRASIPCDGRILDLCPTDSTVLCTGGKHTGSRYTGFLFESTYDGTVLRHLSLSYPGVFLRRVTGGFALQGFRNHLLLFGEDFRILATDHSPLYPTRLAVLRLDDDTSEDLLVCGLSSTISLADTLLDSTIKALGEQESFHFLARQGNRYTGNQYRVDGFLVGVERQRLAASRMLSSVRSSALTEQNVEDAEHTIYRARELFYRIGDDDGVASCDAELGHLLQWKIDHAWFMLLVVLGCAAGGITGILSRRKKPFLIGLLIFLSFAVVQWHVLSWETALRAILICAVSLLAVSFLSIRFWRGGVDIPLPGPTTDRYTSFLMALGAFDHSGRATRILESLNLLLLSIPDSANEYPGYQDRLSRRCGAFLETAGPQVREIAELLQSVLPKGSISRELEIIISDLEHGLAAIGAHSFPDKNAVRLVSINIDKLDRYMRRLRHFVRDYPGAPLRETVEGIVESKRSDIAVHGVHLEIIDRLKNTRIVSISRHELDAICENLLSNSLKALRESTELKIFIELYEEDGFAIIRHSDSGVGISEVKQRELFEPRDSIEKGGFGLPYSAFVLRNAGGAIELGESLLGGATFVINLHPWHMVMRSLLAHEGEIKTKVAATESN